MSTFFKTERLLVRNLSAEDLDELFDCRNNADCARYQHWQDTSRDALDRFIKAYGSCIFPSEQPEQHYAICRMDNRLIGDLSIFYNSSDPCIPLGYTISQRFWRQGYAYEVLTEVIKLLRQRFPGVDIVGLVEKENLPSIALLKKLHFTEEGYSDKIHSYIFVYPAVKEEVR